MSVVQSRLDGDGYYALRKAETGGPVRARARERAGAWDETIEESVYADTAWTVPGMGDRPASCGRYFPREFCNSCGEPHFGVSRCQNRSCPDCWWRWSRDRAARITLRLGAYRHLQRRPEGKRAVHTTSSPPEGSVRTIEDVYDALKKGYKIAQDHGVLGGVAIFHAYRVKQSAKDAFHEARSDDHELAQGGVWQWVRENDVHWRDQVYWSPHVHVVGVADPESVDPETGRGGHIVPGDDERDEGWVFKNIRGLDRFYLNADEGYNDMIGVSRYLLSHLSFEADESRHMIRWFGSLAPASFSPEEALTRTDHRRMTEKVEELTGAEFSSGGSEEPEACRMDDCRGKLLPIWEAGIALQEKRFCQMIGRNQERRLVAAFQWMLGERKPPPGLQLPRSEDDAIEALEAMV